MTNPLLEVSDHKSVVEFARAHSLVSMIDNTFASPINFRPIEHGLDLSLHSGTKYLNGHSDIVAGAVIGNSEMISKVKHRLDHIGGSLDTNACCLLHRRMKRPASRTRHHRESDLRFATLGG